VAQFIVQSAMHLATVTPHHFEERNGTANVARVVHQRHADRLADRLESGEVDDGVKCLRVEKSLKRILVCQVNLVEGNFCAARGDEGATDVRSCQAPSQTHASARAG